MLPPGAAELNLSPLTQTSALLATGLLYCNTQHRRMSEVMLSEMEHVDYEDSSAPIDALRDEGYRLAAGFALGFINLGKGKDLKGLHDMHIVSRLLALAVGSRNASVVHILDKSVAAATVAITLIFMKSQDAILAHKIDVPDTLLQFDYVRPDIFLLRTVAKHLIMWHDIEPKFSWIKANLPRDYQGRMKLKGIFMLSSEDLPFLNIIAGLCLSLGLRFAGSGSAEVRDVLVFYLDQFIRLCRLPALNYDQKLARKTVRNCQDVVALSAATVMAGAGDLPVLRRLRALHARTDADTPYGSHFAAHMAVGMLFLGGGSHTFGTSDLAVGALLCACHPLLPASVLDNTAHLQAFRHLCVLAAEARCLVTRDADTRRPVPLPVLVTLRDGVQLRRTAPCLLPELARVARVATASTEHWRVVLDFARSAAHRASFRRCQSVYVRARAAYHGTTTAAVSTTSTMTMTNVTAAEAMSAASAASIFHATLQALNDAAAAPSRHRFEWLLALPSFAIFDMPERALLLRADGRLGGGVGSGSGSGGGGGGGGGDSALHDAGADEAALVDARLMLEKACVSADKADRLRNLRLLFAFAERAERLGAPLHWIMPEVVSRLRAAVWILLMEHDQT
jgi:anaphase-promoting complex subunit 1